MVVATSLGQPNVIRIRSDNIHTLSIFSRSAHNFYEQLFQTLSGIYEEAARLHQHEYAFLSFAHHLTQFPENFLP